MVFSMVARVKWVLFIWTYGGKKSLMTLAEEKQTTLTHGRVRVA